MNTAERRAIAALWAIQGVGPVTLQEVRSAGPLAELLEKPVAAWAPLVRWHNDTLERVMAVGTLAASADRLERRCRAGGFQILFPGEPAFPEPLTRVVSGPPLLFAVGPGAAAPARRRIAIVGTRTIDSGSLDRVNEVAAQAARAGLGVVSGAAIGVDQAAHRGALNANGETWAFLGSALDQIDGPQRDVSQAIVNKGGTLFSQFPPGFRANLSSFKLRNALISGSSDAVLVFRAPLESGALYTAAAAVEQGRPVLATPGDPWNEAAAGSNELLRNGTARVHLTLADLITAVGLDGSLSPEDVPQIDPSQLSALANQVLGVLRAGSADFEALGAVLPSVSSGALSAALVELELFGAVVHKGGRRYEKR